MCTLMTNREYKERYLQDVNEHKDAEQITLQVLNNLNNGFTFEDTSEEEEYYNKGDIKMIKGDKVSFIDVKDDGEIAKTRNFYIEAGGWSKIYEYRKKGWIDSAYDYVAVISQSENIIWILSFKGLRKYYDKLDITNGQQVITEFWDNIKYGYILPLKSAFKLNIIEAKITYMYDDWQEQYIPYDYKSRKELTLEDIKKTH